MYSRQKGRVRGQHERKTFRIKRGTRQGDPLSPFIFNFVLKAVFERVRAKWESRGWGLDISGQKLAHLCFADDVLLFAKTREQSKQMFQDLVAERENKVWK